MKAEGATYGAGHSAPQGAAYGSAYGAATSSAPHAMTHNASPEATYGVAHSAMHGGVTPGVEHNVTHGGRHRGYEVKEHLRQSIQRRYQKRFWLAFGVYSLIMLAIVAAFFILKESRVWYRDDPFFVQLLLLRNSFPYILACLWAGGTAVILFWQWRQSATDIVSLVDSIEQMQAGEEGSVITVPRSLPELRPILQGIFDAAGRDRRAVLENEQRKNELILYLAHDLKTPLTSVIGYLTLLKDQEELSTEDTEKYVEIAQRKAMRLESLIEQFFEISRLNLHELDLKYSQFDVVVLLNQLTDEFYPLLEEEGKEVRVFGSESLPISGDADKLARALNNIMKNAITYSYPESIIEVCVQAFDEHAAITVGNECDTIPPEQLDSIFDKFYRLDEARTSDFGGAGLGLAISKEIILRHGGALDAESADNRVVFRVTLPVGPQAAQAAGSQAAQG